MQLSKVELKPIPNQTFKVVITFDDKKQTFFLSFSYKELCEYWVMTLQDIYQNNLLSNIPLITGGGLLEAGNLLKQFGYKMLGSMIIYKARQNDRDYPGPKDLGVDFELYWGDTDVSYTNMSASIEEVE